jgi:predicted phosphoribosyltransferase
MKLQFEDRRDAGRHLAAMLTGYARKPDVIVLALPRGGVPVAYEVARALQAPLDVFLVRKLGVPGQEELAMGAIASGGVTVLNSEVVGYLRIPPEIIGHVADREQRELERRERLYRDGRPLPDIHGKTVILVDDGLATGSSMRAAINALKKLQPARVVVAVPVAPVSTVKDFERDVDEVVSALTPEPFDGVGRWYHDFSQTSDEEVRDLLREAQESDAPSRDDLVPSNR